MTRELNPFKVGDLVKARRLIHSLIYTITEIKGDECIMQYDGATMKIITSADWTDLHRLPVTEGQAAQ